MYFIFFHYVNNVCIMSLSNKRSYRNFSLTLPKTVDNYDLFVKIGWWIHIYVWFSGGGCGGSVYTCVCVCVCLLCMAHSFKLMLHNPDPLQSPVVVFVVFWGGQEDNAKTSSKGLYCPLPTHHTQPYTQIHMGICTQTDTHTHTHTHWHTGN